MATLEPASVKAGGNWTYHTQPGRLFVPACIQEEPQVDIAGSLALQANQIDAVILQL